MAKNATDSCACRFNSSFSPLYLFFILHLPWLLFSIMSTSSVTPPAGLRQFSDAEIRSNSSRTEDIRSSSGLSSRNEIIMNITPNMFDHASSKMLKASLSSQTPAHSQKHRMAKAFSDQSPTTSGQRDILQVSDLVVAIPTTHTRLIMILASRNWRKGLRTFITNDKQEQVSKLNRSPSAAAHNESYGFFPEDGGELMKYKRRAHYAGDPRQAMTPFMAHRHFASTYKWMIFGDDDTIFYISNLLKLLNRIKLDAREPHAIADNFWCQKKHPSLLASRCIPCHSNITESQVDKAAEANTQSVFQKAVAAARLKKVPAPQTAPHTLRNSKRLDAFLPKEACMHCSPALACAGQHSGSCKMGEWHGGSGAVFSVGLLERVSYEDVLGCLLNHTKFTGGDQIISKCLWKAGYAFTDPGASARKGLSKEYLQFSPHEPDWSETGADHIPTPTFLEKLKGAKCDEACLWHIENDVSQHLRARFYKNPAAAAAAMFDHVHDFDVAKLHQQMLRQAVNESMLDYKWVL